MNFAERRKQIFEKMEKQSALILFSGIESHVSADEYAPFEANRNFFYLTGLRRDHMILLMKKTLKEEQAVSYTHLDVYKRQLYGKEREWSIGQIKTCRKKQHVKIDGKKEMSELICGKAAVGGNYNSTRDNMALLFKRENHLWCRCG